MSDKPESKFLSVRIMFRAGLGIAGGIIIGIIAPGAEATARIFLAWLILVSFPALLTWPWRKLEN